MSTNDLYKDMDPEYSARAFRAGRKVLSSIESDTILPENGLRAGALLNDDQMSVVRNIRERRLAPVLDRFARD